MTAGVLTPEVAAEVDGAVLCWMATSDDAGRPSVSPKEMFLVYDAERLLIAEIASPRSMRNVRQNAQVCVSVLDIFLQRGHKMEGTCRIVSPEDADFEELSAPLQEMAGSFEVRHVFELTVTRLTPILAPSYVKHPERTEDYFRENAYQAYGVRPAEGP